MKLEEAACILGVSVDTSVENLKQTYRKLALNWHPDKCNKPNAKEKFQQLSIAYIKLVSAHTGGNNQHRHDVLFEIKLGKKGYNSSGDDMHSNSEMASFMRLFQNLLGNKDTPKDASILDSNKNANNKVSLETLFGKEYQAQLNFFNTLRTYDFDDEDDDEYDDDDYDDDDDDDEEDDDDDFYEDDDDDYYEDEEDFDDDEFERSKRMKSSYSSKSNNFDNAQSTAGKTANIGLWEPQVKQYSNMNLKESIYKERKQKKEKKIRQNDNGDEESDENSNDGDDPENDLRKKLKNAKKRSEKRRKQKEKKLREMDKASAGNTTISTSSTTTDGLDKISSLKNQNNKKAINMNQTKVITNKVLSIDDKKKIQNNLIDSIKSFDLKRLKECIGDIESTTSTSTVTVTDIHENNVQSNTAITHARELLVTLPLLHYCVQNRTDPLNATSNGSLPVSTNITATVTSTMTTNATSKNTTNNKNVKGKKGKSVVTNKNTESPTKIIDDISKNNSTVHVVNENTQPTYESSNRIQLVNYLMNLKTPIGPLNLEIVDDEGRTVLHTASIRRDIEIIHLLIKSNRVDIQKKCFKRGWTSLHYAALSGDFDVCQVFLDAGAKIECLSGLDNAGPNVLELVVSKVDQLLDSQAKPHRSRSSSNSNSQNTNSSNNNTYVIALKYVISKLKSILNIDNDNNDEIDIVPVIQNSNNINTKDNPSTTTSLTEKYIEIESNNISDTTLLNTNKKKKKKEKKENIINNTDSNANSVVDNNTTITSSSEPIITSLDSVNLNLSGDELLQNLIAMGFSEIDSNLAITACGIDLDRALSWLCDRPSHTSSSASSSTSSISKSKQTDKKNTATAKSSSSTSGHVDEKLSEEATKTQKEKDLKDELRRINRAWNQRTEEDKKKAEVEKKLKDDEKHKEIIMLQQQQEYIKQQQARIGLRSQQNLVNNHIGNLNINNPLINIPVGQNINSSGGLVGVGNNSLNNPTPPFGISGMSQPSGYNNNNHNLSSQQQFMNHSDGGYNNYNSNMYNMSPQPPSIYNQNPHPYISMNTNNSNNFQPPPPSHPPPNGPLAKYPRGPQQLTQPPPPPSPPPQTSTYINSSHHLLRQQTSQQSQFQQMQNTNINIPHRINGPISTQMTNNHTVNNYYHTNNNQFIGQNISHIQQQPQLPIQNINSQVHNSRRGSGGMYQGLQPQTNNGDINSYSMQPISSLLPSQQPATLSGSIPSSNSNSNTNLSGSNSSSAKTRSRGPATTVGHNTSGSTSPLPFLELRNNQSTIHPSTSTESFSSIRGYASSVNNQSGPNTNNGITSIKMGGFNYNQEIRTQQTPQNNNNIFNQSYDNRNQNDNMNFALPSFDKHGDNSSDYVNNALDLSAGARPFVPRFASSSPTLLSQQSMPSLSGLGGLYLGSALSAAGGGTTSTTALLGVSGTGLGSSLGVSSGGSTSSMLGLLRHNENLPDLGTDWNINSSSSLEKSDPHFLSGLDALAIDDPDDNDDTALPALTTFLSSNHS